MLSYILWLMISNVSTSTTTISHVSNFVSFYLPWNKRTKEKGRPPWSRNILYPDRILHVKNSTERIPLWSLTIISRIGMEKNQPMKPHKNTAEVRVTSSCVRIQECISAITRLTAVISDLKLVSRNWNPAIRILEEVWTSRTIITRSSASQRIFLRNI